MFEGRNRQKDGHKWRRKSALSSRQCTMSQVDRNDDKTTWTALVIAPAPTLSPDLTPNDYWLFVDLKRMLQWKRLCSNEVISETEAYFEAKNKSSYKKCIELFEKRRNQCITLEETMFMNKVEFCRKVFVLLVRLGTYWVMCYASVLCYQKQACTRAH